MKIRVLLSLVLLLLIGYVAAAGAKPIDRAVAVLTSLMNTFTNSVIKGGK